jgi:hypothetical protein
MLSEAEILHLNPQNAEMPTKFDFQNSSKKFGTVTTSENSSLQQAL